MSKPSIPKGTRDFSPAELLWRNFIFSSIKQVFEKHAFLPIETPAMEKLSTLTGKYGEEGDQLLFKVLHRGAKFEKAIGKALMSKNADENFFSEEALRYDLTVPFARYIVQHQNELIFPFKRYQIQPVWRADRPQKGRYREFYQCDADIVGTKSLNCEVELVLIINEVLNSLGLGDHTILLNNRKILSALISSCDSSEYFKKITVIIDKLDKIGKENVIKELKDNIPSKSCAVLFDELFSLSSENGQLMEWLSTKVGHIEEGIKGIEELNYITQLTGELGCKNVKLNLSLARGLDYYTGTIFEVVLNNAAMGSIVGGGRYDNLTEVFGQKDLSGVGISFGAERIYDVMKEMNLFPEELNLNPDFMLIDQTGSSVNGFKLLTFLQKRGFKCVLYPDDHKLKKQLKFANQSQIPQVIFLKDPFTEHVTVDLKNMINGKQRNINISDLKN